MKYRFDEAQWRARREQLVADPRCAEMQEAMPGFSPTSVNLVPDHPVKLGENRFFRLECGDVVGKTYRWSNESERTKNMRLGFGEQPVERLRAIEERPRIEHLVRKPRKHWDMREWHPFFMVSDRVLEILRKFDAGAFETVEVDLVYLRDEVVRGYHFLVCTRALDAIDYSRSAVRVTLDYGRKSAHAMVPLALHADIEPSVHLFRLDISHLHLYVSRELATALALIGPHELRFLDPAGHYDIVEFPGLDSHWE